MNKDAIESLLARVKAATGPDRKIDRDLYVLIVGSNPKLRGHVAGVIAGGGHNYPDYTYSLDAIVRLIKEKLPGWNCAIWIDEEPQANLYPKEQPFPAELDIYESGNTSALACCAAFLTALLSEPNHDQ